MNWIDVCAADEIGIDSAKELLIDEEIVAVFRTVDGLFAIDGVCMHQGGPLARGKVEGGCVTCPWHGWQYRLTDGYNAVTEKPMLRSFEIKEENDRIWILRHED